MNNDSESLRNEMDRRRASGEHFSLKEVVAIMTPLITDLGERHARGATLFVHPDAILHYPTGGLLDAGAAALMPENPRDRACLAPEQRQGAPGDVRASVFACGAILYELVTSECVGPGMRRPSDVVRTLPPSFELLLGKALVADVQHRPADLAALAQALHNCAPTASIPPPRADESHLDHDDGFDVDVSLSMLPPPPNETALLEAELARRAAAGPDAEQGGADTSATSVLAELKARLEADPRPRYIVIRDGMDHGPFSAVELLHQVATGNFLGDHTLRDSLSNEERPIEQWDEFAPFAEQARLSQEAESERHALEQGVEADKQQTQVKAFVGAGVLFIAAAAFLGWYFQTRASQKDDEAIAAQEGQSVDFDGGLKGRKKGGPAGGGRWRGGGPSGDGKSVAAGSHPVVPGGLSCAGARSRYVEEYNMGSGENKVPPDLSAGAYGAVLNRGSYLNSCGVPPTMSVSICAAVQNGRAVGVTVSTKPANGTVAGCVAGRIRSISFPSHPRLDITTTVFKAE